MQTCRLTRLNAMAQVDNKPKHRTKHIIITIELTSEILNLQHQSLEMKLEEEGLQQRLKET